MPTPMIEPIRVWELDAGRPNHQVLRFQIMAAISRAKTMAKPAPLPTCRTSSTGSSESDRESNRAGRGKHADQVPHARPDDGDVRLQGVGIDDRGDGVGGVVEAVDELESEGDEQRDSQQDIGPDGGEVGSSEILAQLVRRVDRARDQCQPEDGHADLAGRFVQLVMNRRLTTEGTGGNGYACCFIHGTGS